MAKNDAMENIENEHRSQENKYLEQISKLEQQLLDHEDLKGNYRLLQSNFSFDVIATTKKHPFISFHSEPKKG